MKKLKERLTYKEQSIKHIWAGTEIFDNVQEVTWLVDQLIPENSISFIAGDKGTTKSWLALETAMSVAMGRDVCGKYKVKQGNVLYLQLEDGLAIVAPRYHKLTRGYSSKPDQDKFKVYVGSEVKFDNAEIFEEIRAIIKDFRPILVVIDTLAQSHSGEENSAKEMSAVINRFKAIRDEFSATVLIVHHVKKGIDCTKKEMRGSSVIKAGAEAILTVDHDPETGLSATHVYTKNSIEFGFIYKLEDSIQNGKPTVRVVI
jgi:RecA-family ATPase